MKTVFFLLLALTARASLWPEPVAVYYHAAAPAQASARVAYWKGRGLYVGPYRDTGSMRPILQGGRELLALEVCRSDTPLAVGLIVQYDRGDAPAVLHYIAAISKDGRYLYLTGVNNRWSDGWFPRERVAYVLREIITAPQEGTK